MKKEPRMIFDFSTRDQFQDWRIINDGVMGGLSHSQFTPASDTTALFQGDVSLENDGGFCSARKTLTGKPLEGDQGASLRVKGDGRNYQLRFRVDDAYDGISYRYTFETDPGAWRTIKAPFHDFEAIFRGQVLADAEPLSPGAIQQIGFLISDKQAGPFRLEVDWIKGY